MVVSRTVSIQLTGGLGNQLFGYVAGLYYAEISRSSVQFVHLPERSGHMNSSLMDLNLEGKFNTLIPANQSELFFRSLADSRLSLWLPRVGRWLEKMGKRYTSPVLGFDRNLSSLRNVSLVRGYFQSYLYLEELGTRRLRGWEPRQPSQWLTDQMLLMKRVQPIVIHVRRGDYAENTKTLGVLDPSYFSAGVECLREKLGDVEREVWVFSDDLPSVELEFIDHDPRRYRFISTPSSVSAVDVLTLMSKAAAIVISNSTFSWWAAALSTSGLVAAPTKWFRGQEDPRALLPEHWLKIQSVWKD